MRRLLRYLLLLTLVCFAADTLAQTIRWRDMYKVKKKDTVFGIAKKYDISIAELTEANPEMTQEGYQLKKGDFIFIPFARANADNAVKATSITKSVADVKSVCVGIMLPLHDVDGDGRRMVEYYRGFLLGCEELKQTGMNIDIHTWNVNIDANIADILKDPAAGQCNIIFGPLYSHQVRGLAEFCKARDIKLVIPFSIDGDDVARFGQIFQVWESPDKLNNSTIDAFQKRFSDSQPVFIDCNDKESKKGVFTFALRNRLANTNIPYTITNLNTSEEMFAKSFSRIKRNVVVLNSGTSPSLTVAIAKLNSLKNSDPSIKISLFGYTEWLMFADDKLEDFFRLDTYVPSNFYFNAIDSKTRSLEQSYARWFNEPMQYALPRFGITGYDHAQFFLHGYDKHGKKFRGTKGQSTYVPLQNPLQFKQVSTAGMQNEFFHLIHYSSQGNIESIAY